MTFMQLLKHDLQLSWRSGGGLMVVVFFIIVVALFPLAVGPQSARLADISVGVIWVAALLAGLLSLDRMFQADYEDGSLDQLRLSPLPLELVVLAKAVAHWLGTALPLIIVTPLLGVIMNLPESFYLPLLLSLLVGSPALSFIGAIGAAVTLSVRRGGVLLSLLILPLYVPVLIFGVLAVMDQGPLLILGALSLFSLVLAPWAAAAVIRLTD